MSDSLPPYAELHCVSNFSFLRGASHPQELVGRAVKLGYSALAITDECSLAGVVRAWDAARDTPLKLIIGAEFRLTDGLHLVLLATDRHAYARLATLITRARRAAGKGHYRLHRTDLAGRVAGCLALLIPNRQTGQARQIADLQWLADNFPASGWLAVELLLDGNDRHWLATLKHLAAATGIPLVATGDVHMHARERRALQDVVTSIRLGCTLQQAGRRLFANAERHLRPRTTLARLYPPALLHESCRIAERCNFRLDELRYEYPAEVVPDTHSASSWLRELTERGIRQRWPGGVTDEVRAQIEHELALIGELQYEHYFLTVHDLVDFARRRGILCQGRGSAANSAVCYCLHITEVDPARMNMLFERFISRERNEPPDIDIDFENDRREEVFQYIYQKYGRHRAALTATVIRYRPKSAIRDVGKALGLSADNIGRLTRTLSRWDGQQPHPGRLREAGFDTGSPIIRRLFELVAQLLYFPRHLSQHVGGFVIARGPLCELVPIENAAMPDRTVIQWDKDDLDMLGLLKIDCLALGMLSAIHRAMDLIAGYRGRPMTMADIPAEDPAVYRLIQKADTVGVFQIESRAQMAMLPRLRPACFYDLVIEVAIVRPGPIQGDMVHPYLRRRQGLETVTYPSAALRKVLERTLGIPIFQEQVIQLAIVAAGFSAGEADRLRRSMAAWKRNGAMSGFQQRLITGMRGRGYSQAFAERIFQQILGFGEYGFPESHAASFALLVYVSAWLKTHEPAAFTAALLNSQPMGFYAPAQLVQDARRHGVEVRPVDVRYSQWDCHLENGGESHKGQPALRLGLRLVKHLSRASAGRLLAQRRQHPFTGLDELARSAGLNRRDMEALAAANTFYGLAGNRHQARWQASGITQEVWSVPPAQTARVAEATPLLRPPTEGEDLIADYGSLGLTLGRHPLALLRERLQQQRFQTAQQLYTMENGDIARFAGLVISRQRPASANKVTFLTLEDESGSINVIVWRQLARRQRAVLLGARLLGVVGQIQREAEVLHLIAYQLEDHSPLLGRLPTRSRDFH